MFSQANKPQALYKDDLINTTTPINFRSQKGGKLYTGYKATLLPDACSVYLSARSGGGLLANQVHIAERCEILIRALAKIGIIGLVDEATGYQEIRAKNALAKILEEFIAKELQPWTRTFPLEFYKEIFRLKGWSFPELANNKKPKTPQVIGMCANEVVYKRLAPRCA